VGIQCVGSMKNIYCESLIYQLSFGSSGKQFIPQESLEIETKRSFLCNVLYIVVMDFFFWPLFCLFVFDLRLLIAPVVSSNFCYQYEGNHLSTEEFTSCAGRIEYTSVGLIWFQLKNYSSSSPPTRHYNGSSFTRKLILLFFHPPSHISFRTDLKCVTRAW